MIHLERRTYPEDGHDPASVKLKRHPHPSQRRIPQWLIYVSIVRMIPQDPHEPHEQEREENSVALSQISTNLSDFDDKEFFHDFPPDESQT